MFATSCVCFFFFFYDRAWHWLSPAGKNWSGKVTAVIFPHHLLLLGCFVFALFSLFSKKKIKKNLALSHRRSNMDRNTSNIHNSIREYRPSKFLCRTEKHKKPYKCNTAWASRLKNKKNTTKKYLYYIVGIPLANIKARTYDAPRWSRNDPEDVLLSSSSPSLFQPALDFQIGGRPFLKRPPAHLQLRLASLGDDGPKLSSGAAPQKPSHPLLSSTGCESLCAQSAGWIPAPQPLLVWSKGGVGGGKTGEGQQDVQKLFFSKEKGLIKKIKDVLIRLQVFWRFLPTRPTGFPIKKTTILAFYLSFWACQ